MGDGIVVFRLIVYLIADDARLLCHVGDEGSDHPLAVKAVGRVDDVHDLPRPVVGFPGRCGGKDVRIHGDEPCGYRIGRGSHNHVDSGVGRRVERAVDVRPVEMPGLGFACGPRGFADANDVDARSGHHLHVGVNAIQIARDVFIIVCCAEQNGVGVCAGHVSLLGSAMCCAR